MRIGHGFDVHRFSDDEHRELWLGLIHIPAERGLDGHSDADVATHALCDALLGASGLGDLGRHFPSSDERWRAVSSRELLARVIELVLVSGREAQSADVTIIAQHPRLAELLNNMSDALSEVVGCFVSVKATTTDGLGAIGDKQGIAAMAVVLLGQKS